MNIEKVKIRKPGRKHRVKTARKVLFFLLSLGVAGICIGVVLFCLSIFQGKPKMMVMGLIYIAVFIAVLLVRAAIVRYDSVRKRRYATSR